MKAVSTSETWVSLSETMRCNISEDCHIHTRHPENLKSHLILNLESFYTEHIGIAGLLFVTASQNTFGEKSKKKKRGELARTLTTSP
jgi:hypothetical protein